MELGFETLLALGGIFIGEKTMDFIMAIKFYSCKKCKMHLYFSFFVLL